MAVTEARIGLIGLKRAHDHINDDEGDDDGDDDDDDNYGDEE